MFKKYYIVSGISRGLGLAVLENIIRSKSALLGISRTDNEKLKTHQASFKHILLDLSDTEAVKSLSLPTLEEGMDIVFINNASTIGPIGPVGQLQEDEIAQAIRVNYTAPIILTNKIINTYYRGAHKIIVANVTSGAANQPIDGWSIYCSTKSAMQSFLQVVDAHNDDKITTFNFDPGVMDTGMQQRIRETKNTDFPDVARFKAMHSSGALQSPQAVATSLINEINTLCE